MNIKQLANETGKGNLKEFALMMVQEKHKSHLQNLGELVL